MKWIGAIITAAVLTLAQSATAAEQVTYYHNDALGSPVAATDESGSLLWRQHYGPWGAPLKPVSGDPRGYTGKPSDSDTGLQDFQARWYDAEIARFHAIDPAGFTESNIHSFNRYMYSNNNPYRYVDPDGRVAVSALVAAAAWAGGAAWTAYDTYNTYEENGAAAAAGTLAVDGAISLAGGVLAKGAAKWGTRYLRQADDSPIATVDDIIRESKPGLKTKGRSQQFERDGDLSQAYQDFDSLKPKDVRDIPNGKVGRLDDDSTAIVRSRSTGGKPTLEIQHGNSKKKTKVRYSDN
ncbi:RHS repeat domain-containing protein [Arhodomonas sp. AD133]|uniref:RHS repeat domain-containing protein n=1 Tax=Arhodomonas sp. AD133 TaxID=3415009 RepID=UPI003EB9DA36